MWRNDAGAVYPPRSRRSMYSAAWRSTAKLIFVVRNIYISTWKARTKRRGAYTLTSQSLWPNCCQNLVATLPVAVRNVTHALIGPPGFYVQPPANGDAAFMQHRRQHHVRLMPGPRKGWGGHDATKTFIFPLLRPYSAFNLIFTIWYGHLVIYAKRWEAKSGRIQPKWHQNSWYKIGVPP